jgi:hypothetical protein
MKNFILALAIVIAQTTVCFAQDYNQIADIDKKVMEIKANIDKYRMKVKKSGDSSIRITTTTYRDKSVIKMITLVYKDNNLDKKTEIYYSNGQMIFHESIWTDSNGKIVNDEKSYLQNHHLIKWIAGNGKEVDQNSNDFKWWDNQLSENSKSWACETK